MVQTQVCTRQATELAKEMRPTKNLRSFFLQFEINDSLAEYRLLKRALECSSHNCELW